METEFCGPSLPPQFDQMLQSEIRSHPNSKQSEHVCLVRRKKHLDKRKHKVRTKYVTSSSSAKSESLLNPKGLLPNKTSNKQTQILVFYIEVDMSDLLLQYTEDIETFKQILNLPDPRDTMPRFSTTIWVLHDAKGQQELRPRGPSAMQPLIPYLKDAFEKFEQDFQAANLSNK